MLPHFTPSPLPPMPAREKYQANLSALRALRRLTLDQREATEAERSALALYTGWGDTAVRKHAFRYDDAPSLSLLRALGVDAPEDDLCRLPALGGAPAYDPPQPHGDRWAIRWRDDADPVVARLLAGMRRSTVNAHYTAVGVVRAMWDILLHLGLADLRAPRVLEPSAGVGHFLGCAPVDGADVLQERCVAVELDPVSAAICRALYPRADVRPGAFEDVAADLPAAFDVVVGNVPFGDYRVHDASGAVPPQCQRQVHDYFVCRSVSLLRPGGVACLITSKGTLDKLDAGVRRWLAGRADLVGAFRLPDDAFLENAGTKVTVDVLVLQRLLVDRPVVDPAADAAVAWVDVEQVRFPGRHGTEVSDSVSSYYVARPEHVLGEWVQNPLVYQPDAGVRRRAGDDREAGDAVRELIPRLPAGILVPPRAARAAASRGPAGGGDLRPATPQEMALGRVLRAVRRVLAEVEAGEDGGAARRLLDVVYAAYHRSHGAVRAAERDRAHPLHRHTSERWWPLVAATEGDDGRRSGIFAGPTTRGRLAEPPRTALDAVYQLIDERGSFTPADVADRMTAARGVSDPDDAVPVDDVLRELRGAVFQLGPDGEWVTRERYCAGDVVGKLDDARRWASLAPGEFGENVRALEAAQPRVVPIADITIPFGAPWVERDVYIAFLRHLFPAFDGYGVELDYVAETSTWLFSVGNRYLLGSVENTRTYGTPRMTAVDLIECGLRLQLPAVYDVVPDPESASGSRQQRNEGETALAQAKLQDIRERWAAWLPRDPARAAALEAEYNRRYNRIVPRRYDGSRLTFPGLSLEFQGRPFRPHPHQLGAALRIVERGEVDHTVMLAHFPGAGKTASAVLGVVKRLQLGLSQRAVIVVPKSVLHQWQATFYELYPGHADWLLAATDRAIGHGPAARRRFLAEAALGDARVVLLTYEQFRTIPLRPETFRAYLSREVLDLERALGDAESMGDADPARRNLERAFKRRQAALLDFEAKYEAKWEKVRAAGDADASWEAWRCDCLVLDEAHYLKNDVVATKMDGVSGLPRGESQRAFDGRVKLHYVTTPELFPGLRRVGAGADLSCLPVLPAAALVEAEAPRPGCGIFLTGTPVTNSLAETWIMMRHLQPRLLRQMGLWHFDAWAATFTTQEPNPEMDTVGKWRVRTRLKFHNLFELQDALGLCWDRVDPRLVQGTRPKVVGERMRVVEVQGSDELREYTQELADRAEAVKKRDVDPTVDNMLKITHDGRCASVFNGRPRESWTDRRPCPDCAALREAGVVVAQLLPGASCEVGRMETTQRPADHCQTCAGRGTVPHRTKLDALAEVCWELYVHSDPMAGCQLAFVDLFTPKVASTVDDGGSMVAALTPEEEFLQRGIYGVIRDKLVAAGMLPREVAYVHDAATDDERRELFRRANDGEVRVLIGSTQKMGLGVNVQRRAYAALHVTVPWRPDWLDQANKRVDRDGNTCDAVHLVCFPTIGSYDVVLWQMIETKSEFVAAINSGTYGERSADDIGDLKIDALTAKAVALGDLRVIEKVRAELELSQLQRGYRAWKSDNMRARFELESLPSQLADRDRDIADLTALRAHRDAHQLRSFSALVRPAVVAADLPGADPRASWRDVADRSQADQRVHVLADSLRHRLGADGLLVGQYRGLDLLLVRDAQGVHLAARLGPDGAEVIARNVGVRGGVGAFAQLESNLASLETSIHRLGVQREILASRLDTLRADAPTWPHADRAAALLARYEELCDAVATAGIVDRKAFRFA